MDGMILQELRQTREALLHPASGLVWLLAMVMVVLERPVAEAMPACMLAALLVVLAVVDVKTHTLPNLLNAAVLLLGVMVADIWWQALLAAVAAYAVFQLVALGSRALLRKEGMGQGDVKLFAALGAWVGLMGLPLVALVGSVLALAYILAVRHPRGARLPFGPFLAAGGWLVFLYQYEMWAWLGLRM
ncbi:MAG: prepilin peptidase [Pseudomonadaceae bacterium]|nr:prepilin peptidase [Pseudomonadaceae bacterium]